MAKILYAWELGADLGHLQAFLSLAIHLRAAGHEVILTARDLTRFQSLPGAQAFEAIQAPQWPVTVQGLPEPLVCYADILQRHGYLDHPGLLGIVKAWRSLYRMIDPGLLIADHAPTALLAARGLPLPRITYGSGFFSPPRTSPMPSIRPWLKLPSNRIEDSETAVLMTVNRVLADIGADPMRSLADLFDVDECFLLTPEELDHYQQRGPARYLRPPLSVQGGATPAWAETPGNKIFAYLKTNHPMIDDLLQQLRESAFNVLVYMQGLSDKRCRALQAVNMRFSPQPVDMHYATRHADALICHAGIGTILHGLLSGLPILLLPLNLEQLLMARNVAGIGAGVFIAPDAGKQDFSALLGELVNNPVYAGKARHFADKYGKANEAGNMAAVVASCEKLLEKGRIPPAGKLTDSN